MKPVILSKDAWIFVLSSIDGIADCYAGDNRLYKDGKTYEEYARDISKDIYNQITSK